MAVKPHLMTRLLLAAPGPLHLSQDVAVEGAGEATVRRERDDRGVPDLPVRQQRSVCGPRR